MTAKQLSIFQQGEDLPLFQQAQPDQPLSFPRENEDLEAYIDAHRPEPEPSPELPACPLCGKSTSWEDYEDGAPPLLICEPCGAFWGSPEEVYQPKKGKTTHSEAHAAKLREIHILRASLNKPRITSKRHNFKGWSQRCRPGAIDRWLRGLRFERAQTGAEKAAAIEAYEAKRQARVDRLHARADKAEAESQARFAQADKMASVIPFGQPILVGHYSEKADRRYRERIHKNMERGMEAHHDAADLRRRAEAAERNRAIFTEDPQASEKIADKIARLEQRQEMMKAANKLVRKEDRAGLAEMGFSEAVINGLLTPDFCGRLGFPSYELKNNGANIRRLKKRLVSLEALPTETTETEHEDYTVIENADEYRIQIVFDGKPPAEVRKRLKAHGFRWAPSQGAWQRHLNNAGRYAVDAFAQWYNEEVS